MAPANNKQTVVVHNTAEWKISDTQPLQPVSPCFFPSLIHMHRHPYKHTYTRAQTLLLYFQFRRLLRFWKLKIWNKNYKLKILCKFVMSLFCLFHCRMCNFQRARVCVCVRLQCRKYKETRGRVEARQGKSPPATGQERARERPHTSIEAHGNFFSSRCVRFLRFQENLLAFYVRERH